MSLDRKIHYIRKWIDLKNPEIGWFINSIEEDWHQPFEKALNLTLTDYQIVKKVEHGELKALLSFKDLQGSSNYLLSNQSSGVTGEIHYVDCGYNLIGMIKPPKTS